MVTLEDPCIGIKQNFTKTCKLTFRCSKFDAAMRSKCQTKIPNSEAESQNISGSDHRRSSSCNKNICFFCDLPVEKSKNPLHLVQSFHLDQRVSCARILSDTFLQAKLQLGDMIAQDALYRAACLLKLYRNAYSAQLEGHFTDKQRQIHGIAFSQLVSFMEEAVLTSVGTIPVFNLSELVKLYFQYLKDIGLTPDFRIHSTQFKNRILSQFEDISEHNEGKEVIFLCRCFGIYIYKDQLLQISTAMGNKAIETYG